jgi:hypothetical protein
VEQPNQTTITERLSDPGIWIRLVLMILFSAIAYIAAPIIVLIAVVQFLIALFTGRGQSNLRALGGSVGRYVGQIVSFLTFHSDARPYPWGKWPTVRVEDPASASSARAAREASAMPETAGTGTATGSTSRKSAPKRAARKTTRRPTTKKAPAAPPPDDRQPTE